MNKKAGMVCAFLVTHSWVGQSQCLIENGYLQDLYLIYIIPHYSCEFPDTDSPLLKCGYKISNPEFSAARSIIYGLEICVMAKTYASQILYKHERPYFQTQTDCIRNQDSKGVGQGGLKDLWICMPCVHHALNRPWSQRTIISNLTTSDRLGVELEGLTQSTSLKPMCQTASEEQETSHKEVIMTTGPPWLGEYQVWLIPWIRHDWGRCILTEGNSHCRSGAKTLLVPMQFGISICCSVLRPLIIHYLGGS